MISDSPLKKLLVFHLGWQGACMLGVTLLFFYFKSAGVSSLELVASFFFWSISPIVLMLLLSGRKGLDGNRLVFYGIVVMIAGYFSLSVFSPTAVLLFFIQSLIGLTCFIYWVPLNIAFFKLEQKHAAVVGSLYFSLPSLMNLVLPLASGVIAQTMGFQVLFSAVALAFLPVLYFHKTVNEKTVAYDLKQCLNELQGFRSLILLEGAYNGGITCAMAVIALYYFKTPVDLAVFVSVTMLFAIFASFFISYFSDRARKRKHYAQSFSLGMGIVTIFSFLAITPAAWYSAMSLRQVFSTLFYPFTTTLLVDAKRKMLESMVGRELLLNIGRAVGVAIVFVCFALLSSVHLALIPIGFFLVAYPVVLEAKKKLVNAA